MFLTQLAVAFQNPSLFPGLLNGLSKVEKKFERLLKTVFLDCPAVAGLSAFFVSAAKRGAEPVKKIVNTKIVMIFFIYPLSFTPLESMNFLTGFIHHI